MCKYSLCLEKLPNLDAKGAKRSVNLWSLSRNVLFYINGRLSNIRSIHTYVLPRTVYFDWICTPESMFGLQNKNWFWKSPYKDVVVVFWTVWVQIGQLYVIFALKAAKYRFLWVRSRSGTIKWSRSFCHKCAHINALLIRHNPKSVQQTRLWLMK